MFGVRLQLRRHGTGIQEKAHVRPGGPAVADQQQCQEHRGQGETRIEIKPNDQTYRLGPTGQQDRAGPAQDPGVGDVGGFLCRGADLAGDLPGEEHGPEHDHQQQGLGPVDYRQGEAVGGGEDDHQVKQGQGRDRIVGRQGQEQVAAQDGRNKEETKHQ